LIKGFGGDGINFSPQGIKFEPFCEKLPLRCKDLKQGGIER
jgi:hypothetical protein